MIVLLQLPERLGYQQACITRPRSGLLFSTVLLKHTFVRQTLKLSLKEQQDLRGMSTKERDLRLWAVKKRPALRSEGTRPHLSARMRELDVLSSSSHIDGSPHENVQVVQLGILLWKTRDVLGK